MGLQQLINRSSGLGINRRKMVGVQYTRNEIARTSHTPTMNPWKFSVEMPAGMRYNEARTLMEQLDTMDSVVPEVITFSDNVNLSWLFAYQGSLTLGNLNGLVVNSFIGNQLVLSGLPAINASRSIFEPNDLIQITGFPYPFTSTTQVLRGSGSSVTVTTHRPNIISSAVAGYGVTVGNACSFNMFCPRMPTYKLVPGGAVKLYGSVINNALIEFSDAFNLVEYVGAA